MMADSKHASDTESEDDEVRQVRLANEYLATCKWPLTCPFTYAKIKKRVDACAVCIVDPRTAGVKWIAISPGAVAFTAGYTGGTTSNGTDANGCVDTGPTFAICTGNGQDPTTYTPIK